MTNVIEIDGKKLVPIREAVQFVSYSRDYITRLAREGRIAAVQVGRQWYVERDSLCNYEWFAEQEAEVRKKQLSSMRKRECEARQLLIKQQQVHDKRHRSTHVHSIVAVVCVLIVGVLCGYTSYNWMSQQYQMVSHVAGAGFVVGSTPKQAVPPVTPTVVDTSPVVPDAQTSLVTEATTSVRQLSSQQQGILLLPQGANASVTAFFSDEVRLVLQSDGQFVELLDAHGSSTATVPFVTVPVIVAE